jgi:WD40 repeat protein
VDPARYRRLSELFAQARALHLAARPAFLDQVGAESAFLRADLEAFLAEDEKDPAGPLQGENPQSSSIASSGPEKVMVGQRIGRYEILGLVGRGGAGVVYQAHQLDLDRTVALKMLLAGAHAGPKDLTRFQREAAAIARLKHPSIVQIYDVGQHGGQPYLSLEFVEGGSLAQKIKGTPQPAREAAQLVETLARAVHAAHQCGIIHRDLNPANVLLTADGVPKITDFGLARRLDAETHQTQSGAILGTPSYMSPEQASGKNKEVGPFVDVYALGAILYELLTGRPPFRAETPLDTVLLVLSEEPVLPPRRLLAKIPRDLETICLQCLRKDPSRRYASALDLADDLRSFREGKPIKARPVGMPERIWRWCRRNPSLAKAAGLAGAALVTAAILAVVLVVHLSHAATDLRHEQQKTQAELAKAQRLSASLALDRGLSLCDEGEVGRGILWLAHSLEIATEANAQDLDRTIRTNLAGWRRQIPPLRVSLPHPANVDAVAFSPDGRTVLTGSWDGTARFWDATTGASTAFLLHHPHPVVAVAFCPQDGKTVLTGSTDSIARLWDATTGTEIRQFKGHEDEVRAVAFSRDGRTALTGSKDKTARLWDVATGVCGLRCQHEGEVFAAAFRPDGKTFVTCDSGGTPRLWDTATGKEIRQFKGHEGPVCACAVSSDGNTLLTGSADMTARLWDVNTGEGRRRLQHEGEVFAAAFSPDGKTFVTGASDRTVRVWDTATGKPLSPPLHHQDQVWAVGFRPDGNAILTGTGKPRTPRGEARLYELPRKEYVRHSFNHPGGILSAALSLDGRRILSGGVDMTARLWEADSAKELCIFQGHTGGVQAVAFSPDGLCVLTASADRTARLWDANTGKEIRQFDGHTGEVRAAVFSPDSATVLTGSYDGSARLWSATTGKEICQFEGPPGNLLRSVAFSPDGRTVLAGGMEGTARLWDVTTGRLLDPSFWHQDTILAVAFSSDGRMVLTASMDGTARIWGAATGRPLGPPLQHHAKVYAAIFSPDRKNVVTGDDAGIVRVWDAETGRLLGPPLRHGAGVLAVAFRGSDNQTVLTTSLDGTARLWGLPAPMQGEVARIVSWAQVITGMELDPFGVAFRFDAQTWHQRRQHLDELGGSPRP